MRTIAKSNVSFVIVAVLLLSMISAQEDSTNSTEPTNNVVTSGEFEGQEVPKDGSNLVDKDLQKEVQERHGDGKFHVDIASIEPENGPLYGQTRVLVRGEPFENMNLLYPKPKCRFGRNNLVVDATYVKCPYSPTGVKQAEARGNQRSSTCLQCDNSPEFEAPEIIPFTVSLVGDFSDSVASVPYRYYEPVIVESIYPPYGPKDGNTTVYVTGKNFLNFDETLLCNFGSKSVKASFKNSTYLICKSPQSDVVEKAIPFSVSLNKQQVSKQNIYFWYYNWPQVVELVPNYGPSSGGNKVLMKGQNFMPFNFTEEIDNRPDVVIWFQDHIDGTVGRIHGDIINSTKVTFVAPPSFGIDKSRVEISLNNQQYTDDNVWYYYYAPPEVFEIDPREGPTRGGTKVYVWGDKFRPDKNITCTFGEKSVRGKWLSKTEILCVSPPVEQPGIVPLTISYEGEKYASSPVDYLYYDTPEVFNITPTCGPVTGYTQITVHGRNFLDMGFGRVKCVFNQTIFMNATIMEPDIIKCDSPPLPPSMGFADEHAPFYYVAVTLNGVETSESLIKFIYYIDPTISSITPNKGPLKGNTVSKLVGKGFDQEGVCNVTVRYGAIQQKINNFNNTEMNTTSPNATIPDAVVVSIALNGQQFIHDKTLHFRDIENTFTYYQELLLLDYSPKAGPVHGHTKITVNGMGFLPFKNETGDIQNEPLWVRFIDATTKELLAPPSLAQDVDHESFNWYTPPGKVDQKTILQISYNLQDWQSVIYAGDSYSYIYYDAPQVTSLTPAYGPVKNPKNESVEIIGKNFVCPDKECKDLTVRWGEPGQNPIYVHGEKINDNTIKCVIPKYTKPDVLKVEVSVDGQEYTNDNHTYGFFDPYILDVQPRLIHARGTTQVRLYGFGFVNSTGTDLKSKFATVNYGDLDCTGQQCIKMAEYINKTVIQTPTFPRPQVNYQSGRNIDTDGLTVEACVYGNSFTENNIEIWYYDEPIYEEITETGSPTNMEKPLYVKTDFKWDTNDYKKFKKYGNFTCKFTSEDGQRVVYTHATMAHYPVRFEDDHTKPDHVRCKAPLWPYPHEPVRLDISVNGQDYSGNLPYTISEPLDLYRIVPMCGPNEGLNRVKLIGQGFNTQKFQVNVRWGILETESIIKDAVYEYIWNEFNYTFHSMMDGAEGLVAYQKEAYNIEKKDYPLTDGQRLRSYVAQAPHLPNWNRTHGGPLYLAVGQNLTVNMTRYLEEGNITHYSKTEYLYAFAMVEYYYYKQPVIKKAEPTAGLTKGGTAIEISGAWFGYRPEYGLVPHCRLGNKIIRAQFFSTVRIVCLTPPNDDIYNEFPIEVSLNGVDFVGSGFKFHYYEQPLLFNMTPSCGPDSGGTEIFITGAKFSNISDPNNYLCRFTPLTDDTNLKPKTIPLDYVNSTTIRCASPGGWGQGVDALVQVTYNGADYSDNNFTVSFYSATRAYPLSGPADGSGGPIRIEGSGFKNESDILCILDKVEYQPIEVQSNLVLCPMPAASRGSEWNGPVPLEVSICGNRHNFGGPFHYYKQIEVYDITPRIGPSEGEGIVYIYGKDFRNDFPYAEPGCRIGNSVGKAEILSTTEMKCIVEEMELVDEGDWLLVTAALNSYSWTETHSNMTYIPYGVTGVFPNSGPYAGGTDILITGKGFDESAENARCRFGVEGEFAIVPAQVLSYDKLVCQSPADFQLPPNGDAILSMPIGIAFQEDEFSPFTESLHRFRFYQPPHLIAVDPDECEVGHIVEVYVYADDESEFWEPIPTSHSMVGQYGIECGFGRFGNGQGMFINKTTIKCLTPSNNEDPDSVWRETVKLTVALNGQDFDEDSDLDFTFVGTGSSLVLWPWIIGTLLLALLILALIACCSAALQNFEVNVQPSAGVKQKNKPYVLRDPSNTITSRAFSPGYQGKAGSSVGRVGQSRAGYGGASRAGY